MSLSVYLDRDFFLALKWEKEREEEKTKKERENQI